MRRVIQVQHQGEDLLLVQLTIQVALDVVDFGLHTGVRLHKHVGVSLDQVAQVVLDRKSVV